MSARRGYEVVLHHGTNTPSLEGNPALVRLNPMTAVEIIDTIRSSGLTPADLRARTLFLVDEFADQSITLGLYAALCGFAGRRLDFTTGSTVVSAGPLHHAGITAEDSGRPEDTIELTTVGAPFADEPAIDPSTPLNPGSVTQLRYSRRVQIREAKRGNQAALTQFVVMAALRVRNGAEYFPAWCSDAGEAVELDLLRREGSELRRSIHTDVRDALVPAVERSARQGQLVAANVAAPMETVLTRLGSMQDPDSGYWRCTRPQRHRNGDANPSMRVIDGKIRCFRCDTEPVDPLRLVIDTLDISPDDAAQFLQN